MEVNLRILQEKAKAWEEKEQRWQEEKMAWIRDNERLKENLRQTEEKWRGQKEEILQIAALQKEQFQNLANDILEKNYHIPPSSFYLERQRLHEQRNQSVGKKRNRGHNL